MKPLMESCYSCKAFGYCTDNSFKGCPKIEVATEGFGVPYKPKKDDWTQCVPFGVVMALKHIIKSI